MLRCRPLSRRDAAGGRRRDNVPGRTGKAAEKTTLFARLSPALKQRIVQVLRENGHVVGFLGDGINDAPALRAADIVNAVDEEQVMRPRPWNIKDIKRFILFIGPIRSIFN
jgi:phosphoserine phosphatase